MRKSIDCARPYITKVICYMIR